MKLYSYWRSSAAWRVRLALAFKRIAYETVPVNLVRDGGDQHRPDYRAINPQRLVPVLEVASGQRLSQSLAIIEYLDEQYPEPALLPGDPLQRARIRAFAGVIACDIHPLNNLRVMQYLRAELGAEDAAINHWYGHWIARGFAALEAQVGSAPFCFGQQPTLADICLVPQIYNARRFGVPLQDYPALTTIDARCAALSAFTEAHPDRQLDRQV